MRAVKQAAIFILSFLFLTSCGYKSTATLAKSVLGENVYIYVAMSRSDPQNTVLIKDAISSALVDRFGSKIVSKERADTILSISLLSVKFNPLVYDNNGYIVSYRAVATLKIDYTLISGESGTLTTNGDYDFPIAADSIISDTKRFEAIRYASADAIDEFTAAVAIKGLRQDNNSGF